MVWRKCCAELLLRRVAVAQSCCCAELLLRRVAVAQSCCCAELLLRRRIVGDQPRLEAPAQRGSQPSNTMRAGRCDGRHPDACEACLRQLLGFGGHEDPLGRNGKAPGLCKAANDIQDAPHVKDGVAIRVVGCAARLAERHPGADNWNIQRACSGHLWPTGSAGCAGPISSGKKPATTQDDGQAYRARWVTIDCCGFVFDLGIAGLCRHAPKCRNEKQTSQNQGVHRAARWGSHGGEKWLLALLAFARWEV
jgi:hypothetical protein